MPEPLRLCSLYLFIIFGNHLTGEQQKLIRISGCRVATAVGKVTSNRCLSSTAGSNGSDDFDPSASVVRHHHHLHHHHLDLSGRSQGFPPRPDQIEDPFATRHSQAEGSPPSNQDHPLLQNHSNHLQLQPPPPTLPVPGIESAAAAAGSAASMENLQLLQEWARRREPVCDLDIRESGVYAKTPLPRGTRYGPFPVNLCHQPNDMQLAWKVSAAETPLIISLNNEFL